MLYTITAASLEVEDFAIELQIESDATFADLHRLIRQTCGWGEHTPSTFHLCDHAWHPERTIPERSMDTDTMDEVELGDLLEDEGQRLQYVFDAAGKRGLLMEVSHIAYGRHIDAPVCRRRHGEAPPLAVPREEAPAPQPDLAALLRAAAAADDEEDIEPTDDDIFELGELDLEGFDFTEA